MFGDVRFHFYDDVTTFSCFKSYGIHVNASITVKVRGRISFHVMAEIWKHLKDTLALRFFCIRIEKGLAYEGFVAHYISGRWTVISDISLALRARDISISQLTSNQ